VGRKVEVSLLNVWGLNNLRSEISPHNKKTKTKQKTKTQPKKKETEALPQTAAANSRGTSKKEEKKNFRENSRDLKETLTTQRRVGKESQSASIDKFGRENWRK